MPLDYTNPMIQKFLVERQNQEDMKRMNWFLRHKEKIIKHAPNVESCKHYTIEQIDRTQMEAGMNMLSTQNKVSTRYRRKDSLNDATNTNDFCMKKEEVPNMKPVDPEESNILYTQLAAGGGRKAYLRARQRKLPEEKYTSCVTTNNVYGWKINESELERIPPTHNRYCIFLHDLVRRSGAHPDPPDSLKPTGDQYRSCIGFE